MSGSDVNAIGPARSIPTGIAKALVLASPVMATLVTVLNPVENNWQYGWSVFAWGATTAWLYNKMSGNGKVKIGFYGVHKSGGGLTGKVFGPGDHPLIPGLEEVEPINGLDLPIDPPSFEELAMDKVPVFVDGYFIVKVTDPVRHLTSVDPHDAPATLRKLFESESRLFVKQWKQAVDMVVQRELLAEFLRLPGDKDSRAGRLFREQLMQIVADSDGKSLDEKGVDNIMADAGKFCAAAWRWGYSVIEVHTEMVDLPKRIKDAAAEAVATADDMRVKVIRQAQRLEMVKELKKEFPGLTDWQAMSSVDLMFGLSVERRTLEIDIIGVEQVSKNLGSGVAKSLTRMFASLASKETK